MKNRFFPIFLFLFAFQLFSCGSSVSSNVYQKAISKVVEIRLTNSNNAISYATGTIISSDGLILTNKHVLQYLSSGEHQIYENIEVRFVTEEYFLPSVFISVSEEYDLGLIRINVPTKSYFENIDELFNPGQDVFTIGNANGFGLSFSTGNISSDYRYVISGDDTLLAIQTDIQISEGCSGGPLFTSKNSLLGIMAFRLIDEKGDVIQGMSFAIPSVSINEYLSENFI